jgi:hypothetical protein
MWRSCGNVATQLLGEKYIITQVCDLKKKFDVFVLQLIVNILVLIFSQFLNI